MLREFIKDCGRYRKGEIRDYPRGVWTTIAGKQKLDSITKPVAAEGAITRTFRGAGAPARA